MRSTETLHNNAAFAASYLDLSFPCNVELGTISLNNVYIAISASDIRGPIRQDSVIVRRELSNGTPVALNALLLEFLNEVHDKTGYPRPSGLHAFPPGPLRPQISK